MSIFHFLKEKSAAERKISGPENDELLNQAQELMRATREGMKGTYGLSLTCQYQLKDDIKTLEKSINNYQKAKNKATEAEKLAYSITKLQTTSQNILKSR